MSSETNGEIAEDDSTSGSHDHSVSSTSDNDNWSDISETIYDQLRPDNDFPLSRYYGRGSQDEIIFSSPEEYLKYDPTPDAPYPRPKWLTIRELQRRRVGLPTTAQKSFGYHPHWFSQSAHDSLWIIQRLELSKRLEGHEKPVNTIDFSSNGNLMCSGGDDMKICVYDWQLNRLIAKVDVGHSRNVLHTEFCLGDKYVLSTSADGSARILDLETKLSTTLFTESDELSKVSFITPQSFVSCGTNSRVMYMDFRMKDPAELLSVTNPLDGRLCPLHTITSHPIDSYKIAVAGSCPYIFIYDLRQVTKNQNLIEHEPVYTVNNIQNPNSIITSCAFDRTGERLLISFNDDDICVYRTDRYELIRRYKGHRNKRTIKGCSWFGDNFVLSGSDDGHIYGWDVESAHIVCFLYGDSKGIVNSLCVHPSLPILASSGLDSNVKVWEPTSHVWPQTLKGIKPRICRNIWSRNNFRKVW